MYICRLQMCDMQLACRELILSLFEGMHILLCVWSLCIYEWKDLQLESQDRNLPCIHLSFSLNTISLMSFLMKHMPVDTACMPVVDFSIIYWAFMIKTAGSVKEVCMHGHHLMLKTHQSTFGVYIYIYIYIYHCILNV